MKLNLRFIIPMVVIALVVFWSVDSLRTRTYSGTDLEFAIGGGSVVVNNLSEDAVPVELVGSGVGSFSIFDSELDMPSSSVREGSGSRSTQTLAFDLPTGVSEFSVARGRNVNFVATNTEPIEASVQSLTPQDSQSMVIFTGVVILLCLYFMSSATEHAWLKQLRNRGTATVDTKPVQPTSSDSQGANMKPFGDNRT